MSVLFLKARVRGHRRKLPSGRVIWVREYENRRAAGDVAEARRQHAAVEKQYAEVIRAHKQNGKPLPAPNGQPSRLNLRQWIQVRTPNFKRWFGDWPAVEGVEKLHDMLALNLDGVTALASKQDVENAFRGFGSVTNENDHRTATFPTGMAGKILGHRGFDVKRIASAFDRLLEGAVSMGAEPEQPRHGHKDHPEILAYRNYANKFEQNGATYYIRFTVKQMKVKRGKAERNLVHSSFVSGVSLYRKGASPQTVGGRAMDPVLAAGHAPYDEKLARWLAAGNPETASKIVDENGEPLVLYHGTRRQFDRFGEKESAISGGMFFTDEPSVAEDFGDYMIPVYAALRNPLDLSEFGSTDNDVFQAIEDASGVAINWDEESLPWEFVAAPAVSKALRERGHDGVIFNDYATPSDSYAEYTSYVSYRPGQIKSAVGNRGTFSAKEDGLTKSQPAMALLRQPQ